MARSASSAGQLAPGSEPARMAAGAWWNSLSVPCCSHSSRDFLHQRVVAPVVGVEPALAEQFESAPEPGGGGLAVEGAEKFLHGAAEMQHGFPVGQDGEGPALAVGA